MFGPEFDEEIAGSKAYIVRALYGCKSTGRDFKQHLRECMEMLGYRSCLADPDLWIREAVSDKGNKYYEYMLLFVDDCLCVSEHPREDLEEDFPMKPNFIEAPRIYIGAKIRKVKLPNGVEAWAMSMSQYVGKRLRMLKDT